MKVRYFVIESKKDFQSIHIRVTDGRRMDQKSRTGLIVNNGLFDNGTQRAKGNQKAFIVLG